MNYHRERFRKLTFRALALCQSEWKVKPGYKPEVHEKSTKQVCFVCHHEVNNWLSLYFLDITNIVSFLASDLSSYITGASIEVTGTTEVSSDLSSCNHAFQSLGRGVWAANCFLPENASWHNLQFKILTRLLIGVLNITRYHQMRFGEGTRGVVDLHFFMFINVYYWVMIATSDFCWNVKIQMINRFPSMWTCLMFLFLSGGLGL